MEKKIYLDYAATTPVDDRVEDAMRPYFSDDFGNPASVHLFGQRAERAVETSRERVAQVLNCLPEEVIFTSCGTESDNLALRGACLSARAERGANRIVTCHTEHHAVSKTAEHLGRYLPFVVDWIEPDEDGAVSSGRVDGVVDRECAIVSVMYANNEIGTTNRIGELAAICRRQGVLFHTDAVQAAAYLDLDVRQLGVDLMSLGGHKFYGPKGVGALYIRQGTTLVPTQTGGSQERGLRAGTHNVPLIVGFAEALQLAQHEREARTAHVTTLRDRIIGSVLEEVPDAKLTGSSENRLPNHASFVFKDVDGNLLLTLLDEAGFACSSGSACKTGNPEPSEVLMEIGLRPEWALGSLRVTVGTGTTTQHVDSFLMALPGLVARARSLKYA